MLEFSIDRVTILAIAIPMITLFFVGYISYESTISFMQKDAFMDRTNLIIQRIQNLLITLIDAETGQRGYIITGKLSYLDPYYYAIQNIHGQLGNLEALMPNDTIKGNLKPLTNLIDSKLAELNQTISLRKSRFNAVLPIIQSDKGKILMDNIRSTIGNIQNQENTLLSNEAIQSQAYSRSITSTVFVATIVASIIVGISLFVINHRVNKRHLEVQRSLQTEVNNRTQELQNANNQLLKANQILLTTERAKEEFISMISHELKTPLVPLKGYAQMLQRPKIMGVELNERQKNAIGAMDRNIEKLQVLVDDVMDVYKLDMGKLKFSMTNTDITKVVDETIAELEPLATTKKVIITTDIRNNETVYCDPNRIEQVISNLVRNSIDFVPNNGQGKLTVRVDKQQDNDNNQSQMTLITVEDNGIGINPDKADKLFQKFYQIDTGYTRKHAGTGLGLVICKGIIDAHGGKIWLDTSYRDGAAIKFTLPQKAKQVEMKS